MCVDPKHWRGRRSGQLSRSAVVKKRVSTFHEEGGKEETQPSTWPILGRLWQEFFFTPIQVCQLKIMNLLWQIEAAKNYRKMLWLGRHPKILFFLSLLLTGAGEVQKVTFSSLVAAYSHRRFPPASVKRWRKKKG